MNRDQVYRYSRQLLLPEIGVEGQEKIINAKVLIVGMGGLGSPVALYLAGAGVGTLGLVDFDTVEINNLHRQIIHRVTSVGQSKAESAAQSVKELNPECKVETFCTAFDSSNAFEIISRFNLVVDASDNVATRYLLNDACVILKKPLVSGSALRFDGQLTTYNWGNGPCYRCLFPKPPPADSVRNCNDSGVVGPIVGVIGSLQALEVIKCIIDKPSYSGKMLIFDGFGGNFRNVKLRERKIDCSVCGDSPVITALIDYVQFCGSGINDKTPSLSILQPDERMTCEEYLTFRSNPHKLIDVRNPLHFKICSLPNSINIPLNQLESKLAEVIEKDREIIFVCRRGNDSQLAVQTAKKLGISSKDIIGGLTNWANQIDPNFPIY